MHGSYVKKGSAAVMAAVVGFIAFYLVYMSQVATEQSNSVTQGIYIQAILVAVFLSAIVYTLLPKRE